MIQLHRETRAYPKKAGHCAIALSAHHRCAAVPAPQSTAQIRPPCRWCHGRVHTGWQRPVDLPPGESPAAAWVEEETVPGRPLSIKPPEGRSRSPFLPLYPPASRLFNRIVPAVGPRCTSGPPGSRSGRRCAVSRCDRPLEAFSLAVFISTGPSCLVTPDPDRVPTPGRPAPAASSSATPSAASAAWPWPRSSTRSKPRRRR